MELIERPGYIGKRKQEKHSEWDKRFGKGNWDFIWKLGENFLNFEQACQVYEDSYFMHSFRIESIWRKIFADAKDVYDNAKTNINSGLDYKIQESNLTHLQDISVRRVGMRRGWKFRGERLIQIRGPESEGHLLTPGLIPFHLYHPLSPELMIERPNIAPKWADADSVESFYQNNRWLAIK